MKKKFINSFILTALFTAVISFKAYAAMDAYLIKDNTNIYQYNIEELTNSFMNSKIGIDDGLYKEFNNILSNGEFYLIYDDEGKYVSYDELKSSFLDKKANAENFNLANEIKLSKASEMPSQVENVKTENNKLTRELYILKDSTTLDGSKILKDKYTKIHIKANNVILSNLDISGGIIVDPGSLGKVRIDNVKCGNINILSGDSKGIIFNKVESNEVKIDEKLSIEIQYEDKGPAAGTGGTPGNVGTPVVDEATKLSMLTKASNQLNKVLGLVNTEGERQVINKIISGITKASNDPLYNYAADIEATKALYYSLSVSEKSDLKDKLMKNVDIINLYQLMSIYGLEI